MSVISRLAVTIFAAPRTRILPRPNIKKTALQKVCKSKKKNVFAVADVSGTGVEAVARNGSPSLISYNKMKHRATPGATVLKRCADWTPSGHARFSYLIAQQSDRPALRVQTLDEMAFPLNWWPRREASFTEAQLQRVF